MSTIKVNKIEHNGSTPIDINSIQVTENHTPTTGSGVEIFKPSSTVGQVQAFDRSGSAWMDLVTKGATQQFYAAGGERLRIDGNNNVGIGTSSPVQQSGFGIHINNNGGQSRIKLSSHGTPAAGNGFDIIYETNNEVHLLNHEAAALKFGTNDAERMRIEDSGNVFIGHSTPTQNTNRLLQIGSTSRSATYLEIRNHPDGDGGLVFSDGTTADNSGYRGTVEYSHSIDALFLKTSGITRFWLNANGVIHSEPTYNNTTSNAANVSCPNSDGQFYRSTSSIKYKDNVTTLTDTLADKILECRPVSYTSKCAGDDKTKINYGLIAEEVNDVDPGLVFLDDGEPEGVQYDRFIPHLINLIKRQKTQIETLETKVAALEAA